LHAGFSRKTQNRSWLQPAGPSRRVRSIQASSFFSTSAGSCGGGARSPARVAVLLVRPAPCEIFSRPRFLAATESSSVQMVSESCERDASPIPPGDRVRSAIKSGRGVLRWPGFARNASLLLTNLDSFLPEPTRGARRSYRLSLIRLAHPEKILARQRRRVLDQSRVEKGELLITVVKHTHSRNAWPIATATLSVQTRLFGLSRIGLFRLIFSHKILFILPALYSCCQPNTLEMACYCLSRHDLGFFFRK